jgi:hypothetical protein
VFKNVGISTSDAGESPRRKHTTYRNFNFLGASAKLARATNSFALVSAYPSVRPHETNLRVIVHWDVLLKSVEGNSRVARIGQTVTTPNSFKFTTNSMVTEVTSVCAVVLLCGCTTDFLVTFLGRC